MKRLTFVKNTSITAPLLLATFLFLFSSLFTFAFANTVLDKNTLKGMPSEEAEEFNRQYSLEHKKHEGDLSVWHTLVHMLNPYSILIERHHYYGEATTEKLKKIELNFFAKEGRFGGCQSRLGSFLPLSSRAKALTSEGGMSKHDYLSSLARSLDIAYPFNTEDSLYPPSRTDQVLFDLSWKYRGKGIENVTTFFNACLSIPIKIFEDEYDTE